MLHAIRRRRGVASALVALAALSTSCAPESAPVPDADRPRAAETPAALPVAAPVSQGLSCIKGGSTREEVRAAMGEPDSVAFGDWLYGRSSVTFGYGVVLDYSNAGGNLVLCP